MIAAALLATLLAACPDGRMRAVDTFRVCVVGEPSACALVTRSSLPAVQWLIDRGWPFEVFFERRDWVCEGGSR